MSRKIKRCESRASCLVLLVALCACSDKPAAHEALLPPPAHLTDADGSPVPDAPEPEVVQLQSVEMIQGTLHITVGNVAGDYALACSFNVNKDVGVQSCLTPLPQRNYLLFRKNTKWQVRGATRPIDLTFMQDWSVTYNNAENIGLLPAKTPKDETFRLFWLSSWTPKQSVR